MVQRRFPVHGDVSFSIVDNFLLIEGEGPANLEAVLHYQREVQGFREQLCDTPWASLVCLRGQPVLPPEATSLLIETIKHAKTMNLVATAVVFVDVEYADYVRRFWEHIFQNAALKFGFFNTPEEAKAWLHNQINNS